MVFIEKITVKKEGKYGIRNDVCMTSVTMASAIIPRFSLISYVTVTVTVTV